MTIWHKPPDPESAVHDWWRRIEEGWQWVNGAVLNIVKVFVIVLIGVITYEYFHTNIVIRPIAVPKTLSDEGITDVVAADELRQRILAIARHASYNNNARTGTISAERPDVRNPSYVDVPEPKVPAALSVEEPDISVPTTGISIGTILNLIAIVIPNSQRTTVSGEFTGDKSQLRLVVSVNGEQVYSKTSPPTLDSADSLIGDAAEHVVADTEPLWAALDLSQHGRVNDADRLLEMFINRSSVANSDVVRAHLLRGMLLRQEQSPKAACAELRKP